ncbi:ABC transporter ATP-binding protein [Streptomyces sp. TRM 70351]|uniref:ABC transporter ATP-binding protein n=1 Tax=Streptomyces sp. TRM 70351 TaxID=3116552 RepID=UPI002E7C4BC7|nr:ABC transporter ATP-binding protein [Streptomyces sp. TRM 70351]MEE1930845.1 ABC transporter ATP-binding protein [Streptomyces sp. TRM 70351]
MDSTTGAACLSAESLHVRLGDADVLKGASLSVAAGHSVAVVGTSGAGKSTLLQCLAGVISPATGTVALEGERFDHLPPEQRSELRLRRFGFLFQFGELVPELSLLDNASLPLWLTGMRRDEARERARPLLEATGLNPGLHGKRPAQVSGGEMQRAALARALVHEPAVLLADEPTGALDSTTSDEVVELLLSQTARTGAALVVVTHSERVAGRMGRIARMADGRLPA